MLLFTFILLLLASITAAHKPKTFTFPPIIEHRPAVRNLGISLDDGGRIGVCHNIDKTNTFPRGELFRGSPFSICTAGKTIDQIDCTLTTSVLACPRLHSICRYMGATHYSVDSYCLPKFKVYSRSIPFFPHLIGYCVGLTGRPANTVIKESYATFSYTKNRDLIVKPLNDPKYAGVTNFYLANSECYYRDNKATLVRSLDKSVVVNTANAIKIL